MKLNLPVFFSLCLAAVVAVATAQTPPRPSGSSPAKSGATSHQKKSGSSTSPKNVDPKANPVVPNVPIAAPPSPVRSHAPRRNVGPVPGVNPPGLHPVRGGARARNRPDPDALAVTAGQVIDGSNWDDQDVADEYTKYTGRRVLLSSATQNLEIRFYQRGPLTNSEAAVLLEKVLGMEGYALVPSGANEVKLLPKAQGAAANAPEEYEDIIDNPSDIPEGDAYISYFMRLNFIKPEEAVRTFTQSINGLGPGAKIAPVPNASAIIITGKSSFIRKLLNQQRYIDVAAGNVSTSWVQLRFADAEDVATTLNEIMNAQQQRKTTAGVTTGASRSTRRPPVPGVRSNPSSASSGASAGEDIPVQIVASPRLNKLFIMGRPVDIVFVEGLAREFDAPPNHNNFIKRKLRFMIASDFLQVASDALSAVDPSSAGKSGSRGGASTHNRRQTTSNRSSSSRNNGGSSSRGGGVESVQEFNVSDMPESLVIGKTLIVADNLANSILVQGPPESLRIVSELIDKLDGRPQQVMISTVFGDMSAGNTKKTGVDWGLHSNLDSKKFTGNNPFEDLLNLGGSSALATAGSGGLKFYGQLDNLTLAIQALEANSDFKVLSRPTVYTANNRKAVISSGQRVAVPTNTFTSGGTVAGASQSTNIEYRDVLLRFEVVPLINSDDEVTLRISLLNEAIQGNQIIDGNEIPTIVTESISTTVTIPDSSTVVLGGLVTERIKNNTSGVPVLSSIPLLGRLFRSDSKEVERRELLIFMQPKIITGELSRQSAAADTESRYKVDKPLREFADGPGVLPSREYSSKDQIPAPAIQNKRHSRLRYPTRR